MLQYIPALLVFICQEVVGLIVNPVMNNRYLGPKGMKAWDLTSILKGILERLVLYTALIHGYPQILIAFAAMKLAPRRTEYRNLQHILFGRELCQHIARNDQFNNC